MEWNARYWWDKGHRGRSQKSCELQLALTFTSLVASGKVAPEFPPCTMQNDLTGLSWRLEMADVKYTAWCLVQVGAKIPMSAPGFSGRSTSQDCMMVKWNNPCKRFHSLCNLQHYRTRCDRAEDWLKKKFLLLHFSKIFRVSSMQPLWSVLEIPKYLKYNLTRRSSQYTKVSTNNSLIE